jgi:hypothetical protein
VGHRTGLDAVVKKKNSQPLLGLEYSIAQSVAQRYTTQLPRLLSSRIYQIKNLISLISAASVLSFLLTHTNVSVPYFTIDFTNIL